jgi:uncharacterized membrane protein
MKLFSRAEAIRFGWETVKNNLGFFIPLFIVVFLFHFVVNFVAELTLEINPPLSFVLTIVAVALSIVMSLGLIKIALKFYDGERGNWGDLFSQYRLFFSVLFAAILYAFAVMGGYILLIIPGIILSIKLFFFDYLIVDSHAGVIESLKKSWAITKGATWHLFVFSLMLFGINVLGALFFLVGLFLTLPVAMLAMAFAYRKLLERAQGASASQSAPLAGDAVPRAMPLTQ